MIDHKRGIRVLRSFEGRTANAVMYEKGPRGELAYDANIFPYEGMDVAGDFDGNGVPDMGGPDQDYYFTGGSLGGIVSGVAAGAEPAIRASAPIVGAGGLTDVAARLDLGRVHRVLDLFLCHRSSR